MIAAVVKDNIVENVIVINEEQVEEMQRALDSELVDARPYGLAVGDLRTDRGWTRNAGGEQVVLPKLEPEQYDSYSVAMRKVEAAEQRAEGAAEEATAQAVAIVTGVTEDESKPALMSARRSLDSFVAKIAAVPKEINDNTAAIRPWAEGKYALNDVRMYDGNPYRCCQAHDSTGNPGWTPAAAPSLWAQYHGTSRESARPWVQPTGAHDQYLTGEWMIWNGDTYECLQDTVYNPSEYGQAWRKDGAA